MYTPSSPAVDSPSSSIVDAFPVTNTTSSWLYSTDYELRPLLERWSFGLMLVKYAQRATILSICGCVQPVRRAMVDRFETHVTIPTP